MRAAALAVALLAGCTHTFKEYEGPDRPREEVALVVLHAASSERTRVLEIDGRQRDIRWRSGDKLALLPGVRRIVLHRVWTAGLKGGPWPEDLAWAAADALTAREGTGQVLVPVEAGRRYILRARVRSGGSLAFEVKDAATGERVAGEDLAGVLAFG